MHPSLRRNNNRQGDMVDLISGRPRAVPFCFCAQRQQVFCIGCIYTPAPFFLPLLAKRGEGRGKEAVIFKLQICGHDLNLTPRPNPLPGWAGRGSCFRLVRVSSCALLHRRSVTPGKRRRSQPAAAICRFHLSKGARMRIVGLPCASSSIG